MNKFYFVFSTVLLLSGCISSSVKNLQGDTSEIANAAVKQSDPVENTERKKEREYSTPPAIQDEPLDLKVKGSIKVRITP